MTKLTDIGPVGYAPEAQPQRMSYAGRTKYDEPGRAERYRERSQRRNAEEWALLTGVLDDLTPPPTTALDAPCGTGRIAESLLERGLTVACADLSPAMREETATRLGGREGYGGVRALDLEAPGDDAPEAADLVVCLRFLHHLPTAAHRARVWATLRSLTQRDLILSFHHPVSVHNLGRALRRLLGGVRGDRHALAPATLRAEAAAAGFALVGFHPLARYRRDFWLAHLRVR